MIPSSNETEEILSYGVKIGIGIQGFDLLRNCEKLGSLPRMLLVTIRHWLARWWIPVPHRH